MQERQTKSIYIGYVLHIEIAIIIDLQHNSYERERVQVESPSAKSTASSKFSMDLDLIKQQTISNFDDADHDILKVAAKQSTLAVSYCCLLVCALLPSTIYFTMTDTLCFGRMAFVTMTMIVWLASCFIFCLVLNFSHANNTYYRFCSKCDQWMLKLTMYHALSKNDSSAVSL